MERPASSASASFIVWNLPFDRHDLLLSDDVVISVLANLSFKKNFVHIAQCFLILSSTTLCSYSNIVMVNLTPEKSKELYIFLQLHLFTRYIS